MADDINPADEPKLGPPMRASQLLRVRAVWISPLIITSILIFLITLIYIGSVVNPLGHLRNLPVLVVNEDAGANAGGSQVHR